LESCFPKTTFRKTNTAKRKNTFLETKPNFPLTGKCFPLTNFLNSKQTQENLESNFPKTTFQKINMALGLILVDKGQKKKRKKKEKGRKQKKSLIKIVRLLILFLSFVLNHSSQDILMELIRSFKASFNLFICLAMMVCLEEPPRWWLLGVFL